MNGKFPVASFRSVIPTAATVEWDTPRKADFWDRGRIRSSSYPINHERHSDEVMPRSPKCGTLRKKPCKLGRPVRAPLKKMPVGMPWERLGADILELPESTAGHRYALVVQDYRVLLNH
ncbi:hypothetical protein D918_08306 [Trichuris suis]|nr:hypothetical protein D918_08306 [Trichuris suis]